MTALIRLAKHLDCLVDFHTRHLSLRHVCHVFRQKYADCSGNQLPVFEPDADDKVFSVGMRIERGEHGDVLDTGCYLTTSQEYNPFLTRIT